MDCLTCDKAKKAYMALTNSEYGKDMDLGIVCLECGTVWSVAGRANKMRQITQNIMKKIRSVV